MDSETEHEEPNVDAAYAHLLDCLADGEQPENLDDELLDAILAAVGKSRDEFAAEGRELSLLRSRVDLSRMFTEWRFAVAYNAQAAAERILQ
jgi:hypothetical protein